MRHLFLPEKQVLQKEGTLQAAGAAKARRFQGYLEDASEK